MHYDYIPINLRPPLHWPDGNRIALIITLNLETWDLVKDTDRPYYAGGPAILPDVLPGDTPDFPNYTWREYGQRVGAFRLFDMFDEEGVKPSCTINAVTALRRRPMLDAALSRGCEILAHNYEQGELLTDFAKQPERERDVMRLVVEGLPNKLIASQLDISVRTVEVHRSRVFEKMDVKSAVELANLLREIQS